MDVNFKRVFSFAFGHAFASTQILGAQDGIAVGKIGHPLPAPDEFESDRMAAQVTAGADDQRQFAAFGDKITEVIGIADGADQPGDVLPHQFQQVGALFFMLAFPPRAAVSKLGGDFIGCEEADHAVRTWPCPALPARIEPAVLKLGFKTL